MKRKIGLVAIGILLMLTILVAFSFVVSPPRTFYPEEYGTLKQIAADEETPGTAEAPDAFAALINREALLLRGEDIKKPYALAAQLRDGVIPVAAHVAKRWSEQGRQKLLTAKDWRESELSDLLLSELNNMIQGNSLYDEERCKEVKLTKDTRQLATQNLQEDDLVRLNRVLLAEFFPNEITKLQASPAQPQKKPGQDRFQGLAGLLALLGAPLFAVIGAITLFLTHNIPLLFVNILDKLVASSSLFVTLPLFTFAGFVLSESNAPQRLVRFSQAFLGWLPGGTALIVIVCCSFFTAFTGASGVTIIAVGGLLYPLLAQSHYPDKFSYGLLTTSGSLGLLFPPSLPVILYAVIAHNCLQGMQSQGYSVDIRDLFLAGILPGILITLVMGVYGGWVGYRQEGSVVSFSLKALGSSVWRALPELAIPFILGIGFFSGILDVEESATVTAGYVLVVEMFFYREVTLWKLFGIIKRSMTLFGAILIILMMAIGLTSEVIDAKIPDYLLSLIRQHIESRTTFLLLLNLFLLIVGCMMDIFSATLVVVPLIVPIALQYDVNPLHLGIIFLTNLEIGYSTPPVGMNLFIASIRFKQPMWTLSYAVLPFLGLRLALLLAITFIEDISLILVRHPAGLLWLVLLIPLIMLGALLQGKVKKCTNKPVPSK
jgi:tripartite ATP-independent transporter DctM subunit